MFESIVALPLTIATLGAGLMAGVYFAFSTFIMRAFDSLGPAHAADAMNAINKIILHSWFMTLFFGSTLLYALLAGYAAINVELEGRWWLFAAGAIYVVGMFLCTALFNVPFNNRLAEASVGEDSKTEFWKHYYLYWTRWNHSRAICSLLTVAISIQYLMSHG